MTVHPDPPSGPDRRERNSAEEASPIEAAWTESDRFGMHAALDEARRAESLGEVPIGAVVMAPAELDPAQGGPTGPTLLARGHNRTRTDRDPTAHAEMIAIRAAARELGFERLLGCTVYTTVEPCFMCAGALSHARVARVVWAVRDPKFGGCVSLGHVLGDARLNHRADVAEGLCSAEARALMQGFFRRIREGR